MSQFAVNQEVEIDAEIARMKRVRLEREGLSPAPHHEPQKQPEWPVIDEAAYYGLAGDIVRTLEPHTEADSVGLLIQFLAAFGNLVGNSPYYQVESNRHHANLFTVLVGASAKGRILPVLGCSPSLRLPMRHGPPNETPPGCHQVKA